MPEAQEPQEAQDNPLAQVPTHPDFARIQEILAQGIEAAIAAGEFDIREFVSQYVDPHSVATIGLSRIMGSGIFAFDNPLELATQQDKILRAAMIYAEAFVTGMAFEQAQDRSDDAVLASVLRKVLEWGDVIGLDAGALWWDGHLLTNLEPEEIAVLTDILKEG